MHISRVSPQSSWTARTSVLASLLLVGACTQELPTSRANEALSEVPPIPSASVSDPSTGTLGASISGYNKFMSPGPITYTSGVSGGVGPYRYDWFVQRCDWNGSCSPSLLYDSGNGMTSTSVYASADDMLIRVSLHVFDSQTYAFVGGASKQTINGVDGSADSGAGFDQSCELPSGFYPVLDYDTRHFRRNVCTGTREYDRPE